MIAESWTMLRNSELVWAHILFKWFISCWRYFGILDVKSSENEQMQHKLLFLFAKSENTFSSILSHHLQNCKWIRASQLFSVTLLEVMLLLIWISCFVLQVLFNFLLSEAIKKLSSCLCLTFQFAQCFGISFFFFFFYFFFSKTSWWPNHYTHHVNV